MLTRLELRTNPDVNGNPRKLVVIKEIKRGASYAETILVFSVSYGQISDLMARKAVDMGWFDVTPAWYHQIKKQAKKDGKLEEI